MQKLTMCFYRCKTDEEKKAQAEEFISRVLDLTEFGHKPECYDMKLHDTHAEFKLK
jgi:hypothetical protein